MRMLVRNVKNTGWDTVESKTVYIRDPDNKRWIRLYPYNYYVRNSANTEWVLVDDVFNPAIDDPCAGVVSGSIVPAGCNAKPNNTTSGSGTGNGSGGPAWDEVNGYPPGYDLPDASLGGFGLVLNENVWPLGKQLKRPGARLFESYDPSGVASQTGLGIYANPNLERSSAFGRGAAVTETVYAVGLEYGFVEIVYASYAEEGISLDVYYRGLRVASTCGRVTGRGRIKFPFEAVENDERIMIRVRGAESTLWALQVLPQKLSSYDDYKNLELTWYSTYDTQIAPDLLTIEYLGTPAFPAPCHAAVWPIADRIQDNKYFEYYHYMGEDPGTAYLDYTSWDNADFVEVYHNGKRLATTLDARQGKGYLKFYYDPKDSGCFDLMVRVGSKDFAANSVNSVYYSLYCVDTRGAREYKHPCGSYEVVSAGHPTTEDCFDLGTGFASDVCGVLIDLEAGAFEAKFEVFDENDVLLDTTVTSGRGTLEFWLPPSATQRRRIYIRVTSAIGSNWRYFVRCPIQKPVIQIPDYNAQHRCEEPSDADGSFDWVRVAHSPAGTTLFNHEWDYGYEYAFVCSEPDASVFNTGMFDKLLGWTASRRSTLYDSSNARLYVPWADKKFDGWFYASPHLGLNVNYHALWFSTNDVGPFDAGDASLNTTWAFEVKESGLYALLTAGDDNSRVTLSHYDKSSGAVGSEVRTVSTSGGGRQTNNLIYLSAGWYHVVANCYNKNESGWNNNPGYIGVNVLKIAELFNTNMYSKLLAWHVTRGSTVYDSSNASLLAPWSGVGNDLDIRYHALWFSADGATPYGGGNATLYTTWAFEVKEAGTYVLAVAGDDDMRATISTYNKATGVVGSVVKNVTSSGGSRSSVGLIDLAVGWYHVEANCYNKNESGFNNNPGYVGVNIYSLARDVKVSTPIYPMFEELVQPWNAEDSYGGGDIRIPAGENAIVTMYKDRTTGKKCVRMDRSIAVDPTGTGAEYGPLLHSVYRRRIKLTSFVSPFSHTWEKVQLPKVYNLEQQASPGYEYWAMVNNEVVFHSRMTHLLRGWQTCAQNYQYFRTYCITEPHSTYSIWASKDGLSVDRVGKSYICPMYEFEAPVTGDYTVQAWGNDDPMFGIYEGPYIGDPTWDPTYNNGNGGWPSFPYKTGDIPGYKKIWYWYTREDDNYTRSSVHLEAGKKYTVRLLCRNYNGGNSYSAMRICLPAVQSPADDGAPFAFGSLSAHHLIVPDPQSQFALPSSPSGEAFATTGDNGSKSVHVGLTYGRPSSIIALDGSGGVEWPGLVALYRRPLYPSMSDKDLSGWRVDARYGSYDQAVQAQPIEFALDRDYYVYVVRSGKGHHMPTGTGVPDAFNTLTMTPVRALCSKRLKDIGKVWSEDDGIVAYADGIQATIGALVKAEADGTQAIIYVLSRPCNVKV